MRIGRRANDVAHATGARRQSLRASPLGIDGVPVAGVTVAGVDVIAGAGRAALEGADKLAKSAGDSRLIVAR